MPLGLLLWAVGVGLVMIVFPLAVTLDCWLFHHTRAGDASARCPICGRPRKDIE